MAPVLQPEPKCTICYGTSNASCSKMLKWSDPYCTESEALDGGDADHALCNEYVTFTASPRLQSELQLQYSSALMVKDSILLSNQNEIAWWLNMCVDPHDRGFAMAGLEGWLGALGGRVLVVQKDGKDINPHQVEALTSYIQDKVAPYARGVHATVSTISQKHDVDEEFIQEKLAEVRQSEVLDFLLNRAYFDKDFARFRRVKLDARDIPWESKTSPYEIVTQGEGEGDEDEEADESFGRPDAVSFAPSFRQYWI